MNARILSFFLFLFAIVAANKVIFNDGQNSQVCAGMYSKHDYGGSIKPHIGLRLNQYGKDKYNSKKKENEQDSSEQILVSYVIFEYKDIGSLGADLGNGQKKYICDDTAINDLQVCDESHRGNFIINSNITNTTIMTSHLTHLGPGNINYLVNRTGYYCISTFTKDTVNYKGVVNFQNAFGQLGASEIPNLPAYGILALCYAIVLALYGFQFYKKRNENQILPLQRYLLAMLGFLTFDTIVVWSYYDLVNRTKNPLSGFVTFYMVFLSILNATKISFCFFLILLIALGYGVVVLKLPKKIMFRNKLFAGFMFISSLFYLLATYYTGNSSTVASSSSDNVQDSGLNALLGLIPLIPIAIALTGYYFAILISIKRTTANLHKQRQIIKLQLYENLFRIMFVSVILTFGGLVLSSFIFLSMSSTEMIEQHWKASFFVFEFWPSVVFFAVFMGVAWLWRPTETSYMLAISQQLATDEIPEGEGNTGSGYHQGHEFELDDLSLLSHSDEENGNGGQHEDNDSFELSRNDNQGLSSRDPPKYDESDDFKTRNELEPSGSNTLFELDDEDDHEDDKDNRLNEK